MFGNKASNEYGCVVDADVRHPLRRGERKYYVQAARIGCRRLMSDDVECVQKN